MAQTVRLGEQDLCQVILLQWSLVQSTVTFDQAGTDLRGRGKIKPLESAIDVCKDEEAIIGSLSQLSC